MQKKSTALHSSIDLASLSLNNHSAVIAEQMLYFFLQHAKGDVSLQEVEDFSASHRINVNDCFSVMSRLQSANIVEKKLYDRNTGKPVLPTSEHHSANSPTKRSNVGVRWALNSAY
ncbi:MAG: hypothetical protein COA99_07510 [Moraxellaceae bacterium]|nr:MAG: hypothetical protein COA99_07510 [Moraxellaceae bacterium]